MEEDGKTRCGWAKGGELYRQYHDEEWGTPCHDDARLFEMLILEGQQAGLSWLTILNKRENFRRSFDNFDPQIIAFYDDNKIAELMQDKGIIRNRLKIKAAVQNAAAYLKLKEEFGSLDKYLWGWVDGKPVKNRRKTPGEIPAHTGLSDRISGDLKKRGFKFVGSTIIYAYLQAVGVVDDHEPACFRY